MGPSQILGQLTATLNRKDINHEEASAVGRHMQSCAGRGVTFDDRGVLTTSRNKSVRIVCIIINIGHPMSLDQLSF